MTNFTISEDEYDEARMAFNDDNMEELERLLQIDVQSIRVYQIFTSNGDFVCQSDEVSFDELLDMLDVKVVE